MTTEHNGPARIEDEIDAALKMLGETQPPATLVSRMHSCLEIAAVSHQARSSRRFLIPAAGMAMAVVLFVVFSQGHWARRYQTSSVESAKMTAVAPAPRGIAASRQALVPVKSSHERKLSPLPVNLKHRKRERTQYRHAANLMSYPLTRQEKLLVEFVRHAKPEDLRDLNPEYQAKIEAQQEAEFAAYLKSGDNSRTREATEVAETN